MILFLTEADDYLMPIDATYLAVLQKQVTVGTLLKPELHEILKQICDHCGVPSKPSSTSMAITILCTIINKF